MRYTMDREEAYAARGIGAARVLEAVKSPPEAPVLSAAQCASLADTRLCREFGYTPSHVRVGDDGLWLVMEPRGT